MSTRIQENISKVKESGLIAIIRGNYTYLQLQNIAKTLSGNGVRVMEITLNSLDALNSITKLKKEFGEKIILGAGTVRNVSQLEQVIEAGAEFSIAPNLDLESVELSIRKDFLHLPGVFTATEIQVAHNAGSRLVKLFPSDVVGPKYLKALRAPIDDIDIVPTGGINSKNMHEYIAAGAVAVGVASSLVSSPEQSMEDLANKALELVEAWNKAKGH
jgi:2-dehydro-3-deoxyphosphogluconate aldolase/(4S)-4-hydroxy-2-oxoglutarate aldolase